MSDQAQGLRRWAERHALQATGAEQTLVVVGPPSVVRQAQATLQRWRAAGHCWVGEPSRWHMLALAADGPRVAEWARQYPRWGLWLGAGPNDCRQAYLQVRRLALAGGPRRLLLLHGGLPARRAQVDNLCHATARFLGVELLVVAERQQDLSRLK